MTQGTIVLIVIALLAWIFWMTKEHLTNKKRKEDK